jgi:hypothetical protein
VFLLVEAVDERGAHHDAEARDFNTKPPNYDEPETVVVGLVLHNRKPISPIQSGEVDDDHVVFSVVIVT